jgi:hypothetical protein
MSIVFNDKPNIVEVSEDGLTVTVISSVGVPGAKGSYTVSATTPSLPDANDVWFNSDDGRTYIYYNDGNTTQWVEFGNANIGGSFGTYVSHTPTFLNVTAGNGTTSGAYCQVNGFVHYYGSFTLGSTSAVTGSISIILPVNINADANVGIPTIGIMNLVDASANLTYQGMARYNASVSSVFAGRLLVSGVTNAEWRGVNATQPMTWDTGDSINFSLYYRGA